MAKILMSSRPPSLYAEADALAANHFGDLEEREGHHFPVLADNRQVVARYRNERLASSGE